MIVNYITTNQPGEEERGSKEEECVAPSGRDIPVIRISDMIGGRVNLSL